MGNNKKGATKFLKFSVGSKMGWEHNFCLNLVLEKAWRKLCTSPGVRWIWEILKRGGRMVQGQVFLKGGGGLTLVLFNFFKVYHFYIEKLLYPLQNCAMHLKKKKISVTITLWKKVILSCLKINLKISHKLP